MAFPSPREMDRPLLFAGIMAVALATIVAAYEALFYKAIHCGEPPCDASTVAFQGAAALAAVVLGVVALAIAWRAPAWAAASSALAGAALLAERGSTRGEVVAFLPFFAALLFAIRAVAARRAAEP